MLIATFGPSTGWAGKTITRDGDVFVLEGHGAITADDVVAYDAKGQLLWASEGTRAWVGAAASGRASSLGSDQGKESESRPSRVSRRTWGIVSACLLVAIVVALLVPWIQAQQDIAKAKAVDDGMHAVSLAIQSYAVDNEDLFPDPSLVSAEGLGAFTDAWPTNPFTGTPMHQGSERGDFTYSLAADRQSFSLIAHGGAESAGMDTVEAVAALEDTDTYGDGIWGQMPGTPLEMIAVKVPADSDTAGKDYWVRSRMDASSEWSDGTFYESADQAIRALTSGGQIAEFYSWIDEAVQEPY